MTKPTAAQLQARMKFPSWRPDNQFTVDATHRPPICYSQGWKDMKRAHLSDQEYMKLGLGTRRTYAKQANIKGREEHDKIEEAKKREAESAKRLERRHKQQQREKAAEEKSAAEEKLADEEAKSEATLPSPPRPRAVMESALVDVTANLRDVAGAVKLATEAANNASETARDVSDLATKALQQNAENRMEIEKLREGQSDQAKAIGDLRIYSDEMKREIGSLRVDTDNLREEQHQVGSNATDALSTAKKAERRAEENAEALAMIRERLKLDDGTKEGTEDFLDCNAQGSGSPGAVPVTPRPSSSMEAVPSPASSPSPPPSVSSGRVGGLFALFY